MRERILTAAIGIPLVLVALCSPNRGFMLGLCLLALALCTVELAALVQGSKGFLLKAATIVALILAVFFALSTSPSDYGRASLPSLALAGLIGPVSLCLAGKAPITEWKRALLALWPALGIIPWAAAMRLMPGVGTSVAISPLLIALIPLWFGDSLAYFVGRKWGKTKLAPELSPKKTWEGAYANLAGCIIGAVLFGLALKMNPMIAVGCGLISGVFGQVGDLLQSRLKRSSGVKDSGTLLPGHGGLLDRLDSFLFTSPMITALLVLVG
jgi:phosphatidate cytidylyltransferase